MSWTKVKELNDSLFYPINSIEVYKSSRICQIPDVIDFAIIFNSCEARAMKYNNLFEENQIIDSLLVNFNSNSVDKNQNYKINTNELNKLSINKIITINNIDIFDFHNNLRTIIDAIPQNSIKLGAKWFMDITGVPSIYSMSLVKLIKNLFPAPELILLNVSGIYSSNSKSKNYFSEGFKEDTWVPFCEGNPDYSKSWEYFFLLGFEGDRSLRIYRTNDPASCKLVIANPGYSDSYYKQSLDHNKCLIYELGYDNDSIIQVEIGDIIGLVDIIQKRYNEIKGSMNMCIVPLGPKPHAIAASIASLVNNDISIIYQVPNRYSLEDIKMGDSAWIYRLI